MKSQKTILPFDLDSVWAVVSNTEQANRAMGLGKVDFGDVAAGDTQLLRQATAKIVGLTAAWTEYPFEWSRPNGLSVRRVYQKGPFKELNLRIELLATEKATVLTVVVDIRPRSFLFMPVAWAASKSYVANLSRYVDRVLKIQKTFQPGELKGKGQLTPSNLHQLEQAIRRLTDSAVGKSLVASTRFLRELLIYGEDLELVEIHPLAQAKAWKIDETTTVRLFCEATKAGVTEAQWTLVCPNCRVPKGSAATMGELENVFHCELCGIDLQSDLSDNVELRFKVAPNIRDVDPSNYCIGSPAKTQHIHWQRSLAAGQSTTIPASLVSADAKWSIRTLKLNHRLLLDAQLQQQLANQPVYLQYADGGWAVTETASIPTPGLTLINSSTASIVVALERVERNPLALTAVKVLHMADFKTLFAMDALTPGRNIAVKNLTILFTDLVGSTAMYETIGDGPAYGNVQRHFDLLHKICQHHGGKIVKTIGDAILATFPRSIDGLKAALSMQEHLSTFNEVRTNLPPIRLRIGLHVGPVIAVEANGKLDYFGRTINIASRVEHEGRADAVIVSEDLFKDEDVQEFIATQNFSLTPKTAQLKGIERPLGLTIITPQKLAKATVASTNFSLPNQIFGPQKELKLLGPARTLESVATGTPEEVAKKAA